MTNPTNSIAGEPPDFWWHFDCALHHGLKAELPNQASGWHELRLYLAQSAWSKWCSS